MEPTYDVVWPLGEQQGDQQALSARPTTLDGLTIGFVWDYIFKGDRMFEHLKDHVRQSSSDVRFVDYPEFGNVHGTDVEERANVAALPERLKELEVDLVVVGVGA